MVSRSGLYEHWVGRRRLAFLGSQEGGWNPTGRVTGMASLSELATESCAQSTRPRRVFRLRFS